MIRWAIDTLGGLIELCRLALVSRFRLRSRYWQWRWQTAFGRGAPATRLETVAAVLQYARWVRRMRRGQ
jgi:hypothetical protein